MPRFMVLYVGPPTPPDASHEGWPAWFDKLGDKLVDRGSPLANGRALRSDGSTGGAATRLNGYSIIQAEDVNEALGLVKDHPYLAQGRGYSIEAYLLP
jgi:YCII-related domain